MRLAIYRAKGDAEPPTATMDEAGSKTYDFGTDVLVDIIRRLPPSSRRRVRFVCRRWRGAVDDRTSEMLNRTVRTRT